MKINLSKIEYKYFSEEVAVRDNIEYTLTSSNEPITVEIPNSTDEYETILKEDIACEIQRDSTLSKLPVVSERTVRNGEKLRRILNYYGKKGYHVATQNPES